jgi:hypothetical protein
VGSTTQIKKIAASVLKQNGKMELKFWLDAIAAAPITYREAQAKMKETEKKKQSELEQWKK